MNKFQKVIAQCTKDDMKKPFKLDIDYFGRKRTFWRIITKDISFESALDMKNENKLLPF